LEKVFVLDTNVLLIDPLAIMKFGSGNIVYIPLIVVEEVDRFKKDQNENGRNARHFSRLVDELRQSGPVTEGIEMENGGKLIISIDTKTKFQNLEVLDLSVNDNIILTSSLSWKEKGHDVSIISKDINLRLKADVLGLNAEDYGKHNVTLDELYSGNRELGVTSDILSKFEKERFIPKEDLDIEGIFPNEYVLICEENNSRHRIPGRYSEQKGGIVPLITMREGIWGVYPKNLEQQFAFDSLLNDEVKLVSLTGKAGTGKTLLAIAAGLELTITQERFSRVLVSRPVQPMGKDIGFLPGDVNDKLGPWMQPIFDNMDFLFGRDRTGASWEELINQGLLHIEPLTYIRGRSIPKQYLIVDESQNLSPHEIKTIVTRAGEGTKIVLTGDCEQIDSPYLDSINNGLAHCIERLKGSEIIGHMMLKVGERSPLSEIASQLL
jgi:PhoH-like ATPase